MRAVLRAWRAGLAAPALAALTMAVWSIPAHARVDRNDQGQISTLTCGDPAADDEERTMCGADGPAWTGLYGADGRLVRQVLYDVDRLVEQREFDDQGRVRQVEKFERRGSPAVDCVDRQAFFPGGALRQQASQCDGRPVSELDYLESGVLVRKVQWDARNRPTELSWYPDGMLQRREIPADENGQPAHMTEEYWDNGQLKQRGMFLADGRPLGLVQTYHRDGAVASERYYEHGRLRRMRAFDDRGRPESESDFDDQGHPRAMMQR